MVCRRCRDIVSSRIESWMGKDEPKVYSGRSGKGKVSSRVMIQGQIDGEEKRWKK